MLFNSLDFAVFLPIVFLLYWSICKKQVQYQNTLLLLASYVFYGWWDWRFLSLILFSTSIDYIVGLQLYKHTHPGKRKLLLYVSLIVNLGFLGFFKYYNFFLESFTSTFTFFGGSIQANTLNIILPVGISFYTFQTLSYTIDIYRRKLKPTKSILSFATFVSFFPQLVAGPIERAGNLLPQFHKKRLFNKEEASIGLRQIIWGLFKKIVIADSCAPYVEYIFSNVETVSSTTLILGVFYFAFQIYGDFSGYSDIAIGTARLFNIRLSTNFRYPYFSRSIQEFWRRWHISLSTWFRDYIYIPLGGKKCKKRRQIINISIVFAIGGLWHGANWTFIVWGLLHALFIMPSIFYSPQTNYTDTVAQYTKFPSFKELLYMVKTFSLVLLGWVFFRAESIDHALVYLNHIVNFDMQIELLPIERYTVEMIPLILLLISVEWIFRKEEFPLIKKSHHYIKSFVVILMILLFGSFSNVKDFIYFQF